MGMIWIQLDMFYPTNGIAPVQIVSNLLLGVGSTYWKSGSDLEMLFIINLPNFYVLVCVPPICIIYFLIQIFYTTSPYTSPLCSN